MTLIVEDGTIVPDANTYLSDIDADEYFTLERPGVTDWFDFSDDQKEASLRFATKLLDEECWYGMRTSPSIQELAFPRSNLYHADKMRFFRTNEIPAFLKCAVAEFAVALVREDRTRIAETVGGTGLERVKIDVLEIEWMQNAAQTAEAAKSLIPDIVDKLICKYIGGCGDGITVPLLRT